MEKYFHNILSFYTKKKKKQLTNKINILNFKTFNFSLYDCD